MSLRSIVETWILLSSFNTESIGGRSESEESLSARRHERDRIAERARKTPNALNGIYNFIARRLELIIRDVSSKRGGGIVSKTST